MDAVVRAPEATDTGPRLLLDWAPERRGRAWAGSVVVHLVGLVVLLSMPATVLHSPRPGPLFHASTTLIAPPTTLTQKSPNRAQVGKEFTLDNLVRQPRFLPPPGLPPIARAPLRAPALPRSQAPALDPPKLESAPELAQGPPLGASTAQPPPPQIQTEERKPKLAFETPGAGGSKPAGQPTGRLPAPSTSVTEATRAALHAGQGGLVVGDMDIPGTGGLGPGGLNVPTAPGRRATALELLSDPMGVDFKPYLIQVLAAVKRNWLAVIPESARLGRPGKTVLQFAISRDGQVPKLVIAMPSGTDALDRAAVAGVSASNPFPPLPAAFQGEQVRLQFTFLYNMR